MTHIFCPGCNGYVRELNYAPCPECKRCAFCGTKIKGEELQCECGLDQDPALFNKLAIKFSVPEHMVARETRRFELRKQSEIRQIICKCIVCQILFLIFVLCFKHIVPGEFILPIGLIITYLGHLMLNRVFYFIENRRLDVEFSLDGQRYSDKAGTMQ